MKLNINDEQGIELLYFIFERELKPPFQKGKKDNFGRHSYYNRDGKYIAWLTSEKYFSIKYDPLLSNIEHRVCQAFGFSQETSDWWYAINPLLKSWMENQLNVKLNSIYQWS